MNLKKLFSISEKKLETFTRIKIIYIKKINSIKLFLYLKFILKKAALNKVLILMPDKYGSLGDEAMVISVIQNIKNKINLKSDILSLNALSWGERLKNYDGFSEEILVEYNYGEDKNFFNLVKTIKQYKYFIIIGADVLDGYYSEKQSHFYFSVSKLLTACNSKVVIMGSSFNKAINPSIIKELEKRFNKNFTLNIRDLKSLERISKHYKKAIKTMDIAFLLDPVFPESYHEFIAFENKGPYISISINALHHKIHGTKLIEGFINYINYIVNHTDFNIVLVPHDIREHAFDIYSDYQVLEIIYSKTNNIERVFFFGLQKYINTPMLKYVAYKSIMVVTGRMHYSIAALSNGIPVIVMPYQGKFEGMLLEIYDNIDNYILEENEFNFNELITKTNRILSNLQQEKILIEKANIKEKARKNLDKII